MNTTPYRKIKVRSLCGVCKEEATARCQRCGRPLCNAHQHRNEERCEACEEAYSAHPESPAIRTLPDFHGILSLIVLAVIFATPCVPQSLLPLHASGIFLLVGLFLILLLVLPLGLCSFDYLRRRFFLVRRKPGGWPL